MTPKKRRNSTSMITRYGWNKVPLKLSQEKKRQLAAEKIIAILEEAMNDMGLTEDQKEAKVAEMEAIAMDAVKSNTSLRAKRR